MPDHNTPHHPTTTTRPPRPPSTTTTTTAAASAFLRRLHEHYSPNSTHLMSVLTLLISGGTLLALTGLTVAAVVSCLVFLVPLLVLSLPLWLPIVTLVFVSIAAFLSLCGLGVTTVAAASWLYRYFRGLQPPGSDRFDYARSRLASTAREVKDYAKEYSGYLHSKVKDAAPGA